MAKTTLHVSFVLCILMFTAFLWSTPLAFTQGSITLDGVAGANEWDPGWQVSSDPLDVYISGTGQHPHTAPTYARSGYDAVGLWAHYDAAGAQWYFRLDVDGRVADSDSQTGTSGNLGVGTHGQDDGPLVNLPFTDNDGIGSSEVYRLEFQYESGGIKSTTELGGNSSLLPALLSSTTAGLAGQGIYGTTVNPGVLEWSFARDVIVPSESKPSELWIGAQVHDANDSVSDDIVSPVLLAALSQSVNCPASLPTAGFKTTFTAVYTVPIAARLGINDVALTIDIPDGSSFVGASNGGVESGSVITWNLGYLSPGSTDQMTFTLATDAGLTSMTLDSEIASAEGLRFLSNTECQIQEPYLIYLPLIWPPLIN